MLLKLRRKKLLRHPLAANSATPNAPKTLSSKGICKSDTRVGQDRFLAADVHLCSADNYGRSLLVEKGPHR